MTPVTSNEWGRVDDDRTVYVKTADGERAVGQYPEGTPEEVAGHDRSATARYLAELFAAESGRRARPEAV